MSDGLEIDYAEPWRETETFLRLLPGPMFSSPPTNDNGLVIRHYSTTISRKLRDHPKMRVDLSDPDDRENVARRVWPYKRPAYDGDGFIWQSTKAEADGRRFITEQLKTCFTP